MTDYYSANEINWKEIEELCKGFERVEKIKEIIILGKDGGIRRIILNE